jgi:hypothetical protein
VFILLDLKSFVFSAEIESSEVFILLGLKSFILVQIVSVDSARLKVLCFV